MAPSPKLTKTESKKLKSFLTREAILTIAKKKKISVRMVELIRDGVFGDRHGVIECLIYEAKVRKDLISLRQHKVSKL